MKIKMKPFREWLNEKSSKEKGIYVGMKLSDDSNTKLIEFIKQNDIPNPIDKDDLHSTIIYSRKYDDIKIDDNLKIKTKLKGYKIFNGDKNALVALLDCSELSDIHNRFMTNYELIYDYDEYIPHITFSYDVGDFDIKKLPLFDDVIELVNMYKEDLDLDWSN